MTRSGRLVAGWVVKRAAGGVLLLLLLLLRGGPAEGQIAWDGPFMVAPASPAGWGLYLVDPSPRGGVGVMSTWRTGGPVGFRIGLGEDLQERLAVFGGVDVSGFFVPATDDFPFDVDWVTGVGFGVGQDLVLSALLGLSVGRELMTDDIWFNPYLTPRVVLDADLGGEGPDGTMSLGFALDLGMDLAFEDGWAVRFAGSVVDRRAIAIGFSFRVF